MPISKIGISEENSSKNFRRSGFSLIELLVVLGILSMMAGIALPSIAVFKRHTDFESLSHNISVLCRETFQRSVYTGKEFHIDINSNKELVVSYVENFKKNSISDFLLRPVKVPDGYSVSWPDSGWKVIPEGYCESIKFSVSNLKTSEIARFKIRPFDGFIERQENKMVN